MLELGAQVNGRDRHGKTSLMLSCLKGQIDVVRLLPDTGADVNVRDHYNQTPLVFASLHGHKRIVSLLLDRGADVNVKTRTGRTALNLGEIRDRGLHYLVATRQSQRDQWLEEFEDTEGFREVELTKSPTNPYQKKTPVRVRMKLTPEETHVLCLSAGRTEKDRAIRRKQEQRFPADLDKLRKRIADGKLARPEKIGEAIGRLKERYPRVARYHRTEYDSGSGKLKAHPLSDKIAVAESLDGSYLLKTDRKDLSPEEAWRIYTTLTKAENAFRAMKSPLAERPIFHQLPRRVDTHIFLCVMAYHILVAIEKTLRDKGVHTSLATVRDQLKTHKISTIVLPTNSRWTLKIRKASTPEPEHRELYRLLEVPEEVVPPKRFWVKDCDDA